MSRHIPNLPRYWLMSDGIKGFNCTFDQGGKMLTHMSLFTGIGGMDLAADWAGFETVGQCEWADYQTKVLEKHWPNVPRWRDIRSVTAQDFVARTGMGTVTVLSGGFPCQPFSVAGKQRGSDDDRYLWPEMLRVISELRPTWVIGENVPGIINMALDQVLSDLEGQGYEVQTFLVPACGVDAPHRRERVFIVAYSGGDIGNTRRPQSTEQQRETRSANGGCNVADSDCTGCEKLNLSAIANKSGQYTRCDYEVNVSHPDNGCGVVRWDRQLSTVKASYGLWANHGRRTPEHVAREWWTFEPRMGRVVDGVSHRVDRLKCLGNAVVPAQVYPIFKFIADIERAANQ